LILLNSWENDSLSFLKAKGKWMKKEENEKMMLEQVGVPNILMLHNKALTSMVGCLFVASFCRFLWWVTTQPFKLHFPRTINL